MEGEGGPKRSYTQEAKIKRNKKRALIKQKPKCKKTKTDKTGQKKQSNNRERDKVANQKSKFNSNNRNQKSISNIPNRHGAWTGARENRKQ